MKPLPNRHHRIRRLKALIAKEFRQVVRDPSSILIAFVLPVLLLFMFGYGVSLDARDIPVAVVVQDPGPLARDLAEAFEATPYFEVKRDTRVETSQEDLVAGRVRGVVVIGPTFSRDVIQGNPAPIQLLTDGSETNTASFVQNYTQGLIETWMTQQGLHSGQDTNRPVSLNTRFFYNPELNSRFSLVPGSLAIIMSIIGILLTALVVAREWERGTMEALLATPVGVPEIVLGKLIPYFSLGMLSMLGSTAVAIWVFGVPFRGSILALLLVGTAFLLTALAQGLLISTALKNQFLAAQVALVSGFLPAFLLSGFIFEISSMPWVLRVITLFIPARYLVSCLKTLFLAGDVWLLILPKVLILLLMAGFFFALTAKKTSKRLC